MRKIIQIEMNEKMQFLHALCDDGTVWFFKNNEWKQFADIPQEPIKGDDNDRMEWQCTKCAMVCIASQLCECDEPEWKRIEKKA